MPSTIRFSSFVLAALLSAAPVMAATHTISPGPDAQEKAQEALILAEPGDTVAFAEGTFDLTVSLSLDVDNVTVVGQGMDKTILSFKNQDAGAEGLIVTSDGVTLRDFAIEDSKGDAIKAKGCDGIFFINVRTEWTGGPKSTNGAYGLYPVESSDVLIDGCVAIGASDAGIYVGQSKNIIVRNSRAEYNVAGIEIENSYTADVYDNVATHNTGGVLVFDLPGLPQQGGRDVRVFRNKIVNNDTANFAPEGNIVGAVAKGTGLMIMANRNVEAFENEIDGNSHRQRQQCVELVAADRGPGHRRGAKGEFICTAAATSQRAVKVGEHQQGQYLPRDRRRRSSFGPDLHPRRAGRCAL